MSKQQEEISYATNRKGIKKMKVVFVGDQYVGKTSIITRFIKNTFDTSHNATIGIDFVSKNVTFNNKILRLQLWDTAGQERFRSLIPSYLRDCQAAFIIFDLTNQQTFENVTKWIDFIKQNRGEDVIIYVVGNKADLDEERTVDKEAASEKIKKLDIKYFQTSAKTAKNIQNTFQELCGDLLEISPEQITQPLQIHNSKIIGESEKKPATEDNIKHYNSSPTQKLKAQPQNPRRVTQKNCC